MTEYFVRVLCDSVDVACCVFFIFVVLMCLVCLCLVCLCLVVCVWFVVLVEFVDLLRLFSAFVC